MDGMLDKKILDVPHLSQILDVTDEYWKRRACPIVALSMILKYYLGDKDSFNPNKLIEEGLSINAYSQDVGWKHENLVLLARNYGLHGYSQEFRSLDLETQDRLVREGLDKVTNTIVSGNPVIVSVKEFFSDNKATHTILLTGVEKESGKLLGFYYRDPILSKRSGKDHEFVDLKRFLEFWRKMTIFVSKEA